MRLVSILCLAPLISSLSWDSFVQSIAFDSATHTKQKRAHTHTWRAHSSCVYLNYSILASVLLASSRYCCCSDVYSRWFYFRSRNRYEIKLEIFHIEFFSFSQSPVKISDSMMKHIFEVWHQNEKDEDDEAKEYWTSSFNDIRLGFWRIWSESLHRFRFHSLQLNVRPPERFSTSRAM